MKGCKFFCPSQYSGSLIIPSKDEKKSDSTKTNIINIHVHYCWIICNYNYQYVTHVLVTFDVCVWWRGGGFLTNSVNFRWYKSPILTHHLQINSTIVSRDLVNIYVYIIFILDEETLNIFATRAYSEIFKKAKRSMEVPEELFLLIRMKQLALKMKREADKKQRDFKSH